MKTYREVLQDYIPEASVSSVLEFLSTSNVQLKITKSRSTKLGDYRPPIRSKYHKISINHDLNKYHFLVTLIHEFAHLDSWEKHHRKVKPHGKEWKQSFRDLMDPYLNETVFPEDILIVLHKFLKNPTSSSVDTELTKKMREYDTGKKYFTLEELSDESLFKIHNGVIFKKLERIRKRYKCKRMDNNRIYLISPIMEVIPIVD
jgi:SprT protein